jgi:hypothetical protein
LTDVPCWYSAMLFEIFTIPDETDKPVFICRDIESVSNWLSTKHGADLAKATYVKRPPNLIGIRVLDSVYALRVRQFEGLRLPINNELWKMLGPSFISQGFNASFDCVPPGLWVLNIDFNGNLNLESFHENPDSNSGVASTPCSADKD